MSLHFIVCLIFRFIFLKIFFSVLVGKLCIYLLITIYGIQYKRNQWMKFKRVIDLILEQITAAKLQNTRAHQPLHLHVIK